MIKLSRQLTEPAKNLLLSDADFTDQIHMGAELPHGLIAKQLTNNLQHVTITHLANRSTIVFAHNSSTLVVFMLVFIPQQVFSK